MFNCKIFISKTEILTYFDIKTQMFTFQNQFFD